MTAGTIEEKIYHRQIFKQFLTNRVLKDPKQQRFFKTNDLYELFTLNEGINEKTESSALFAGTGSEIAVSSLKHEKRSESKDPTTPQEDKTPASAPESDSTAPQEDEKTKRMRQLARLLSKKIGEATSSSAGGKKGKKDKVGKKLEGERISNLVKRRRYKYATTEDDADGQNKLEKESLSKSQDEFVLRKLFKKSGVHTALSHDAILNSGDPDYLLLEGEASRVASEALRQVRASRARCLQLQPVAVSKNKQKTFGNKKNNFLQEDNKRTKKKKKKPITTPAMFNGGMEEEEEDSPSEESQPIEEKTSSLAEDGASSGVFSSAQLLKKMRERNQAQADEGQRATPPDTSAQAVPRVSDPYGPITYDPDYPSTADPDNAAQVINDDPEMEEHVELLTDIRNFVAFQAAVDGQASTDEVVERFKERLPPSKNHIFKALLQNICDFVRDSSGQGLWYLKGEFR